MAAGVSLVGIESPVVTVAAAPVFRGDRLGPRQAIAPGRRSLVAQTAEAARAIVTGAMSIALVPSRAGLGLIVVAAR